MAISILDIPELHGNLTSTREPLKNSFTFIETSWIVYILYTCFLVNEINLFSID